MQLLNIGFGNMLVSERVVAVVSPDSAPIKRVISDARENGSLVDATYGRKTKTVIITDSEHIVLSALTSDIIAHRLDKDYVDEVFSDEE